MTISVGMIVKNEEKLLPKCLESIIDYVEEVIVVDNGSTDQTLAIAQHYGCKIISAASASENEGRDAYLEVATQPWIFVIDADERMTPKGAQALHQAATQAPSEIIGF